MVSFFASKGGGGSGSRSAHPSPDVPTLQDLHCAGVQVARNRPGPPLTQRYAENGQERVGDPRADSDGGGWDCVHPHAVPLRRCLTRRTKPGSGREECGDSERIPTYLCPLGGPKPVIWWLHDRDLRCLKRGWAAF